MNKKLYLAAAWLFLPITASAIELLPPPLTRIK